MGSVRQLTEETISAASKAYGNQKKQSQLVGWPQRIIHFLKLSRGQRASNVSADAVALPDVQPSSSGAPQVTAATTPQELALAAVTLGLAATSALLFPPVQLACLPLLLYLGVTPAHTAYAALRTKERAPLALAETVVLALCLLRQAYLAGAVSYGCYVVGKAWLQQQAAKPTVPAGDWQPPIWAWVQPELLACPKLVAELHTGERIVVHTGEIVPVAGVVIDGVAWVKRRDAGSVKVAVGSKVDALTIVQVGCIWLTVG